MANEKAYLTISKQVAALIGGSENIQGAAHCATRLRIVLKDSGLVNFGALERIDRVKGAVLSDNQLQLVFGAGVVEDIYEVFSNYIGIDLQQQEEALKLELEKAAMAKPKKRRITVKAVLKSISDVFVSTMPAILAAALLMGLTGILETIGVVRDNDTFYALNRITSIASASILNILPMLVCYSAVKRYGGTPILGMVMGAIMLDANVANPYDVAAGTAIPEVIRLLGFEIELVGFQGGIFIAVMIGFITAKLDLFFRKRTPDVLKLLVAPTLTVFVSVVLLYTVIGPAGRIMTNMITDMLMWCTQNLGAAGYAVFAGVQQLVVITGLHHVIDVVEAQLLADKGVNFMNPLMSVAVMGQGGALLGYLARNWKIAKSREVCIPSFISILCGISEPALFGINIRYRYPLISGCIGGAAAAVFVYYSGLTSLGFGTSVLPGFSLVNPENDGYVNYIIAHGIALGVSFILTVVHKNTGMAATEKRDAENKNGTFRESAPGFMPGTASGSMSESVPGTMFGASSGAAFLHCQNEIRPVTAVARMEIIAPVSGVIRNIEESSDSIFASKIMGDGVAIESSSGEVRAPYDAEVVLVMGGGHAIGLRLEDGSSMLIHCGIDTVNLEGQGFSVLVKKGEKVQKGQLLLRFDKALIEGKGYSTEVILMFNEIGHGSTLQMTSAQIANKVGVIAFIQRSEYNGETDGENTYSRIPK